MKKILLEKRTDSNRWAFAGGGMKMDESFEDCIRRKVKEETNLTVTDIILEVFAEVESFEPLQ